MGNVYSWKETRFRWTTVILLTFSSTGASADLPIFPEVTTGTFLRLSSKKPIQILIQQDFLLWRLGHLTTLSGQKKMEEKVKHFPYIEDAQIGLNLLFFIYDGNSGKTFEGGWGYVDKVHKICGLHSVVSDWHWTMAEKCSEYTLQLKKITV